MKTSSYYYDLDGLNNNWELLFDTRLAHKGEFENDDFKKKYESLSDIGGEYISQLEFLFAPLDTQYLDDAESYLINKVVRNGNQSRKYFLMKGMI